ncbi:Acetyl esterase [Frankia canadensis]|uniref:Acetyl esterase n=2 Tax=Frankia canadensis TaxID=1836972 RepID=A0A2I2KLT5_9ACTN|nr:Acetyl esterase [Frankia canadensis]SOU53918.1 Acetyl esterase [Frankia canadensis]
MRRRSTVPMREAGAAASRARAAALRDGAAPGPEMASVERVDIPGRDGIVPTRRYRPRSDPAPGVVVYFHGGGWVVGGLDESDGLCRTIAEFTSCEVLSVGYRLAPEHRFPAAVHDAEDAVAWVANRLAPEAGLVVMGDSAGGNLAAVVARRARDRGGSRIDLQVLVYPVTDHRMTSRSYTEHAHQMLISADDLDWFWSQYVPRASDRASPDASPGLVGDLAGLPPAVVVVAEYDPLRDESLAYARRLADAGVETTVYRYHSMAHGFFSLVGALDTAVDAVRSVSAAIVDMCAARRVPAVPRRPGLTVETGHLESEKA